MRKTTIISMRVVIVLISLFILIKPSLTGHSVYQENSEQKIKLGYCPTMQEEAEKLCNENNYELINLGSASEVLSELKNNQIDKALIGRKAEKIEIGSTITETVLKSGYTLVSREKGFIDYSKLPSIEVYTYLSNAVVSSLIPASSKIIYQSESEVLKQINAGKIALISWDDWSDDFELIVVMNGNEKVKDFRGAFLYEN